MGRKRSQQSTPSNVPQSLSEPVRPTPLYGGSVRMPNVDALLSKLGAVSKAPQQVSADKAARDEARAVAAHVLTGLGLPASISVVIDGESAQLPAHHFKMNAKGERSLGYSGRVMVRFVDKTGAERIASGTLNLTIHGSGGWGIL